MRTRPAFRPASYGLIFFALAGLSLLKASAITLTGSNGRAVEFAGIKEATEKGITAQVSAEGVLIGVPWSKLDLEALKSENPAIFTAYRKAMEGENVTLNLGIYAPAVPRGDDGMPIQEPPRPQYDGWETTTRGGVKFFIKMPKGAPKGILLVASGDRGNALPFAVRDDFGISPWREFQSKHQLAIFSYEYYNQGTEDPTVLESFADVEKNSGKVIIEALEDFASKLNVPDLASLPFCIHGSERTGAALAYSFLHWKPERVIAAVLSKGAFYNAEPSASSVKVPVLFVWGQYSNNADLWKAENHVETVFQKEIVKTSNWTSAREFRGSGMMSASAEYLGMEYLLEMIPLRLQEAPEAPEGEEEASALAEIDRGRGFTGQFKGYATAPIVSADAPVEEGATFIPTSRIAEMWAKFASGQLELPAPQSGE